MKGRAGLGKEGKGERGKEGKGEGEGGGRKGTGKVKLRVKLRHGSGGMDAPFAPCLPKSVYQNPPMYIVN